MCCDMCSSEFVVQDVLSTSVRCPDCNSWVAIDEAPVYASSSYSKGYVDTYVDFDMDNYAYED